MANYWGLGDYENRNVPTLILIDDVVKIQWSNDIFLTLSENKRKEIMVFSLCCYEYKKIVNIVLNMRQYILSLMF
jgi:hypothetical protein